MVWLFCVIVGVVGNPFSVSVDEGDSVDKLKKAIKVEIPDTIKGDAKKLQLFLAKTESGAWLDGAGAAAVKLGVYGHLHGFKRMDSTLRINNDKHFGKNFQPDEGQIHVLLLVPRYHQAAPIEKQLGYKRRSSKASRRKFLDPSEIPPDTSYNVHFNCGLPTMDVVLYALDNDTWNFRWKDGQPLTKTDLHDYFDKDERTTLRDLNKHSNLRIHDGVPDILSQDTEEYCSDTKSRVSSNGIRRKDEDEFISSGKLEKS
ncbi:Crinkler (CRN) [Phytophthora megakarya]|uniref:Crinkler (CRN) n=1 Tax=Phytophthora megakarya TaxID=4795 RepID=A0A225UDI9_9STRA|nr:Crinkler (CRN) [Phytophthora megakarya]